ncbi:phosphoribosylaminoimidazolesuccinocarboxamide synthase [bacterium]|nr:phosphoribosylaminoimidazolesuccinocarboxamide synthase [bacterium]
MKTLGEGKTKIVLFDEETGSYFLKFKNSITAFNSQRKDELDEKGRINCEISYFLMKEVEKSGLPISYEKKVDDVTIKVKDLKMIPVEVVVRNIAYGSFLKRFTIKEGERLKQPIVEFFFKDDEKNDPQLTRELFEYFELANLDEVEKMKEYALKVNEILKEIFHKVKITLVDFKIEFGRDKAGNLLLADEIDPDSCRLWDFSGEMLDKERYRRGLGEVMEHYQEILKRLRKVPG